MEPRDPLAYCLITTVPGRDPSEAKASAEADGWTVLIHEDTERRGVGWNRNQLFQMARQAGAEYIRYMDDDDLLYPHRAEALLALQPYDIINLDYTIVATGPNHITMGGSDPFGPWSPQYFVDAWGWVAKTDALVRMEEHYGRLWCDWPCGEGMRFFHDAAKILNHKHFPIMSYQYRMMVTSTEGHNHPLRDHYMFLLHNMK